MTTRMFVAAVPPAGAAEDLEEFLAVRREAAAFRWTPAEHWHLTLAFLPAVPDRCYDELVERLRTAAGRRVAFPARIAGGGAFPDPSRAKVLWAGVGVGSPEELTRLAEGCRAAAVKSGVEVGGDRFRPHLTVARISRPTEVTRWIRVLDSYQGPEFALDEIALLASHLGEGPRKRPRYEVLETFALGGQRSA